MKSAKLLLCAAVIVAGNTFLFAQANVDEAQGIKPYDSLHGGDLDSVSLITGGLALHIPLASFPQRGSLDLSFGIYYSNKQWTVVANCTNNGNGGENCTYKWQPLPRGGALPMRLNPNANLPMTGAYVTNSLDFWLQGQGSVNLPQYSADVLSPDGSVHQFGTSFAFTGLQYPMRSLDATGFLNPDANTVVLPNGTRVSYSGTGSILGRKPASITDANGNQITVGASGWTDTMNRAIPGTNGAPGVSTADLSTCPSGTTSAQVWDVPSVAPANGGTTGTRRFKFCYSQFTISTALGGATEYGPATNSLLSAVVLPDLTMWTLSYDNYGDVTHLVFPTGGSITYTYDRGTISCGGPFGGASMWVKSRAVDANDGSGPHTWLYSYSGQFTNPPGGTIYTGQAKVTSPDGNDTVHTITSPVPGAHCSLFDTQVQYFQGAAGGTPLKTEATQYTGIQNPADPSIAVNVIATQVSVTQGGQTSRIVNQYDSGNSFTEPVDQGLDITYPVVLGSVLQRDEYDFSNTLVRSTFNHYLWQDNATYKTNNFISLPVSTTMKDGNGCEVAKTSHGFDETYNDSSGNPVTLQPSLVSTQFVSAPWPVRGNHTSSSSWLITACAEQSAITSHTIPYNTGLPYQVADPLGHYTQYTYSLAFAGAYLTQTNLPDTQMPDSGAPVVHHIMSGDYDLNTGVLIRFTDENLQNFTYKYDDMLRLTQGIHPDGGQTLFSYPTVTSVERQRLITGTTYDDFKVLFDGLGRPVQSQQTTPDCVSKIKVDTVYDLVGRVASVSNPYCLTTEPTYGVTQSQYDAMSRTIKTIKQDASFTKVKFEDTPGDPSDPHLVCTTATDETGKQRQACSDALGRLVKVLEQNPGAPATFATGSVIVSGTEQSTGGAATSGSGTVTIGGVEQSACDYDSCPPSPLTYDSGTVYVTVNGVQKSATYSRLSTRSTIAAALRDAFHNDGTAPVDASCGDQSCTTPTITLTARATGASTNYSLSVSVSSGNSADFTPPSFSAGKSGSALTGGHDAGVSDSGNLTITVNGTNYTTTFGTGDTSSTIASRLAGLVNSGAFAYASASGGTVNLTSKTAGGTTNYSLSASYTYNSGTFAQPSFTTLTGGGTLAGGYDASAIPNHPFISHYRYDTLGNLLCVHQKGADSAADKACADGTVPATWRPRKFTYDSLGRLLTSYNPEAGSMTYQYDNAGNMTSKIEPKPNQLWGSTQTVTVIFTYDALNRLTDKSFSDGTQNSSYRYDYSSFLGQTFLYPIGREVAATAASNTIQNFTSYDQMGRVKSTVQCNPGVTGCKTFSATYDKLGDLSSLAYPANGFSVTYGYDSAARVTTATDSSGVIYAQSPMYVAGTAIKEFASPNFNNNKYHVDYNNRLQPTEIWTGTAPGASALFDKQYSYGSTGANNGNVYAITNVKDSTRTQTFTYDVLNRLISAQDQTHWANTYTYDAWGNMQKVPVINVPGENLQIAGDTNNHMLNYTYDAAGNMQSDGTYRYAFDAENRIACMNPDVNWICNSNSVTYTYDADGRRIKKSNGANYWYGPGGQALAETDAAGNWTNYIFFGGQRLARNVSGDIKYYITDHLHSTAMFVDRAGAILDDNDMYPWGGVVPGVGQTTSNNAVKFTGQYRDGESQLDYFGPRYYSNLIGRWMSPDWSAKPTTVPYAKFGDPQSLNLYSYTENGPVTRIDNGHGYAGFDGFMRPSGGAGVDSFNESHNGHGEGTLVVSKEQRTGYNMVGDTIEVITPVQLMPAIQNNTAKPSGTADACYAQLRYRYVKGGTHAWWALGIGLIDFTISGTGDWSFSYPVLHDLNAYVTEGTTSRSNPGDNLKNGIIAFDTKSLHGGFASPDDCSVVKAILKRGQDYEQHHNGQFSYDPSGLEPRTSNTIAYYVGWPLHSYTSPPPGSVGWGIMLEGLTYGK